MREVRHCVVPPHILKHMSQSKDRRLADAAHRTIALSEQFRGHREAVGPLASLAGTPTGTLRRTVYDCKNSQVLPGKLVRAEGQKATKDVAATEAYDAAGSTYHFYMDAYQRNSVDDRGLRLDSTVHYGSDYDNAFWNGKQMVYGDGDGVIFQRFTKCLDVIGHELTHGVTQYEAALEYHDQPGALNESMSDVFGSLVKQYSLKQTADKADWLIGSGLLAKGIKGVALRSMKAPGTAYNDPQHLGKDPQPATMKDYVTGDDDNGGVHINSGIPNHAFYLAAAAIGGFAWEKAGLIWYRALTTRLHSSAQFSDAAAATVQVAGELYGSGSAEAAAVMSAWAGVGVAMKSSKAQATKKPVPELVAAE
jgi:Zn-dependent metalloprotease